MGNRIERATVNRIGKLLLAGALSVGIAGAVEGCAKNAGTPSTFSSSTPEIHRETPSMPSQTSTVELLSPTLEPTSTSTPEVKSTPCVVLEEKYCKDAKFINNPDHPDILMAVFKLPTGTSLFSPIDGYFSSTPTFFFKDKVTGQFIKYPGGSITDSNIASKITIHYDLIYFTEGARNTGMEVKKGETVGTLSDKPINYIGDYNLIVMVSKQRMENGKIVFDNGNDVLEQMFPQK